MRAFVFLANLLLFAVPLAAQDSDPVVRVDADPVTRTDADPVVPVDVAAPAGVAAHGPAHGASSTGSLVLLPIGIETRSLQPPVESRTLEPGAETPEDGENAALQPDRRNWWWTVGAIVTAGVILAVLL